MKNQKAIAISNKIYSNLVIYWLMETCKKVANRKLLNRHLNLKFKLFASMNFKLIKIQSASIIRLNEH